MKLDDLTNEWRLMADLYALAIELDRVRFGASHSWPPASV